MQVVVASTGLGDSPQTVDVTLVVGIGGGGGDNKVYLPLVLSSLTGGNPACTPDLPGESDNVADALIVCSNRTASGQVGLGDGHDVYRIPALANQQMTISMVGSGPGDADLYLYPPGTGDVNTDPVTAFSANLDNNEFIQHVATVGGEWYISVYSYDGGQVDYSVTVTLSGPGPGSSSTRPIALNPTQAVKGDKN